MLFACYVIAYIDRVNVSLAKLTMSKDLPAFNNDVIGAGAGIFFIGYLLLEIPGTLLVERWSARKWIGRIMMSWGVVAALTAWAKTPGQFYAVRFLLGLAEAGFFPGVIVYLTHWFPRRDRVRALGVVHDRLLHRADHQPQNFARLARPGNAGASGPLGLAGWQWLYIAWGMPAVVLGVLVFFRLPDHPRHAKWLSDPERLALEQALAAEKAVDGGEHNTLLSAMRDPRVLLLAVAYFCIQSGNYGIDIFLPSILERWYGLKLDANTWLIMLPPAVALVVILLIGWNSDRTRERRLHAASHGIIGGIALALAPHTHGHLLLTMICFIVAGRLRSRLTWPRSGRCRIYS